MKTGNPLSPEAFKLLEHVQYLLDNRLAEDALQAIDKSGMNSEPFVNAQGVCLLQLGHFERAKWVFRDLVFPKGELSVPEQTPIVLRTNYITALLFGDNMDAAIGQLKNIPEQHHPQVQQLWQQIRQWRRTMSWWQRMLFVAGLYPGKPFGMDGPPGQLWIPQATSTHHPKGEAK